MLPETTSTPTPSRNGRSSVILFFAIIIIVNGILIIVELAIFRK